MSNFIKILKTSNLCLVPVSVLSGLVNMNNNDTTFRTFIEFAPTKNVVSIVNNVKYDSFCYHNGQRFINSAFKTPIEFHQSFKKIYFDIGHSNSFTKNMFSNVSQSRFNIAKQALLTNKILASCFGIYKGLNRLLFHPKEDVIEWDDLYAKSLCFIPNEQIKWGLSQFTLGLESELIWAQNETFNKMRNKARYVDKEYLAKELYDFDNVTNSSESLYGAEINLVHKYKSDFILSINQKKPAQFISTLNSTLVEHPDENSKFVPIDTKNTLINAVAFDFNKLVCISDVDYDFKLLKISTNNDLLNLISKSYKNWNNLTNEEKSRLKQIYDIDEDEQIYEVLNDIKDNLKFILKYKITDQLEPSKNIQKQIQVNWEQLVNGINIFANIDNEEKYKIQIDDFYIQEYSDEINYIAQTDLMGYLFSAIKDVNYVIDPVSNSWLIELNEPSVSKAIQKDYDASKLWDVYVNDLSEQQIINDFFILLDEDNKVFQFKHLNVNEYKILKNPLLGTINVTFFLKENQFDFILEGFKKYPIRIETIDGSVCETNLIGSDVNTTMVKKMIELNGFHKYLSEILDFSLTNIDDEKGKITVKITRCDDLYLRPHYLNSSFSIKNLKSYYLKQNNNIDEYFLKKKPSEITLSDFKENFITMSSEFKNRNSENLIIKLKSDDGSNRLTANISYIDSKTKNEKTMTMVFENFKKNNSVVITILIVLICLAGVSVLGFIAWKLINKKRKFKLMKGGDND